MKKLFTILLAFTILLCSVSLPIQKKAYAADSLNPSVAANVTKSAGVYAIAGMLIAAGGAVVTGVMNTNILEQATTLWDTLSPTVKQSFTDSISLDGKVVISNAMKQELLANKNDVGTNLGLLIGIYESKDINSSPSSYSLDYNSSGDGYWFSIKDTNTYGFALGVSSIFIKYDGSYVSLFNDSGVSRFYTSTIESSLVNNWNNSREFGTATALLDALTIPWQAVKLESLAPSPDVLGNNFDTVVNGINDIDIPLDNWLNDGKSIDGTKVITDATTGTMTLPDGTTYDGTVTYPVDLPITGVITGATVANPAIPIEYVFPRLPSTPTGDTGTPTGTNGPWTNFVPFALMMALLDLLRAILMYLVRMFQFIITLPVIPAIPINNEAFDWFRNAEILGIHVYSVVSSMASIGFSFLVLRAIRKVLSNA